MFVASRYVCTIGEADRQATEALEILCYRKMFKIKQVNKITNERFLDVMGERRSVWGTITSRRDRFVETQPGLIIMILVTKVGVECKNCRGRQRLAGVTKAEC